MRTVYVSAEVSVDVDDVLDRLDDDDLREIGYAKVVRADWEKAAQAMRDGDMDELCRQVSENAYNQTGMTMPPLRAAAAAKVA